MPQEIIDEALAQGATPEEAQAIAYPDQMGGMDPLAAQLAGQAPPMQFPTTDPASLAQLVLSAFQQDQDQLGMAQQAALAQIDPLVQMLLGGGAGAPPDQGMMMGGMPPEAGYAEGALGASAPLPTEAGY